MTKADGSGSAFLAASLYVPGSPRIAAPPGESPAQGVAACRKSFDSNGPLMGKPTLSRLSPLSKDSPADSGPDSGSSSSLAQQDERQRPPQTPRGRLGHRLERCHQNCHH